MLAIYFPHTHLAMIFCFIYPNLTFVGSYLLFQTNYYVYGTVKFYNEAFGFIVDDETLKAKFFVHTTGLLDAKTTKVT